MPEPGRLALVASAYGKSPTELCARTERFERGERARRAALLAGPLLLACLPILPIPVVHLLVIPLGICAIVFGRRRWRETERILAVEGPCPGCASTQAFPSAELTALPATVRCPGCGEFVNLERKTQAEGAQ